MTRHLAYRGPDGDRPASLARATLPPAWHVPAAVLAVVVELGFAMAVLVPRTAWLWVLGGIALDLGVYASMQIGFFQTMLLYCVFVGSLREHWPAWLRVPRRRPIVAPVPEWAAAHVDPGPR